MRKVLVVKRALPLWLLAALPSTLLGHWLAYAGVGRTLADGRHVYAVPSLEISGLALGLICAGLLAGAVIQAGFVNRVRLDAAGWNLWLRLAPVQVALFAIVERVEGYAPSLTGCVVQCALAAVVAVFLGLFARYFSRCVLQTEQACAYLRRLLVCPPLTLPGRKPLVAALALGACVGPVRFGRPPPRT